MSVQKAATTLSLIAFFCAAVQMAHATTTQIDISSLVNTDLTGYTNGNLYPPNGGPLTVAGVSFTLATLSANNHTGILQSAETPSSPSAYTINVNQPGVTAVYTLMNSAYGVCGTSVGELDFAGAKPGDTYTYVLTEGTNIRDHNNDGFCNAITSAAGTANFGGGQVRLDMQLVNLPAGFASDTLQSITFKSYGLAYPDGWPFLAAVDVSTPAPTPEASTIVFLALGVVGIVLTRFRRTVAI